MKSIRALREERELTRLELANMIRVTPGSIYNWERGVYEPKARQLRALAQAFGVPMDAIDLDAPNAGMKAGGEAA